MDRRWTLALFASLWLALVPDVAHAQRIVATVGSPDPTAPGATLSDVHTPSIGADGFIAYVADSATEGPVLLADEDGRSLALAGPMSLIDGVPLGALRRGLQVAGSLVLFAHGGEYATWDPARGLTRVVSSELPLPDGSALEEIGSVTVNPSGEVLFIARSASTLSGAYLREADGTLRNVLRSGQSVPSHPEINIRQVVRADLADDGRVAVVVDAVVTGMFGAGIEHQFLLAGRVGDLTTLAGSLDLPGWPEAARRVELLGMSRDGHVAYVTEHSDDAGDESIQTLYLGTPGSEMPVATLVGTQTLALGGGYSAAFLRPSRSGLTARVANGGELALELPLDHSGVAVTYGIVAFHDGAWSLVAASDQSLPQGDGPDVVRLEGLSPEGHVVLQTPAAVYRYRPGASELDTLVSINEMLGVGGGDVRAPLGVGAGVPQPIADDGTVVYRATWADDDGVTRATIFSTEMAATPRQSDLRITNVTLSVGPNPEGLLTDSLLYRVEIANEGPAPTAFAIDLTPDVFEIVSASCPISGTVVTCTAGSLAAYEVTVYDIQVTVPGGAGRTRQRFDVRALDTEDPVADNNYFFFGLPLRGCQAAVPSAAAGLTRGVAALVVIGLWLSVRRRRRSSANRDVAREAGDHFQKS